MNFAKWFLSLPSSAKFRTIHSDEAYVTLSLPSNKQNNRLWSTECPNQAIELPLHDQKVLVWCAISSERIYGPYFFEESVNQQNYLAMLKFYFWTRHLHMPDYKNYYFQQDGATPHTASIVQNFLFSKFKSKFIDKTKWPPYSPDLNVCDFFLWGYLKAKVYNPLPKNLDDLKMNITREIKKINKKMLNSAFCNFEKRCQLIISADGGHIE